MKQWEPVKKEDASSVMYSRIASRWEKYTLEKIKISGSIIPNTFQAWPLPISGSGRNEIVTCAEYNRGKCAHNMYSMTRSIFHIFAYCFHHFYAPFEAETSNISETFIARRWHLCIQIGTTYKNCTSQAVKIISAQRNFIESLSQKVLCLGSGPEMWYKQETGGKGV